MISRTDTLWLVWKILRGRLVSFTADSQSFRVTLDFTAAERSELGQRLARQDARSRLPRGKR